MQDDYHWFQSEIFKMTGINLALYKEDQMRRRLSSLKSKHGAASFVEYHEQLKHSPKLLEECLDKITINVTEFFRNKQRWDVLEQTILPSLISGKKDKFKVWSSACSTGEEPYSLSILLSKHLSDVDYDILATDIDQKVLDLAKRGVYPDRALKEVSDAERKAFFIERAGSWAVNDRVKQSVRFRSLNLLADRFERNFDLILCRNVVIYFTDAAKHELYGKLANALNEGGVLFVGSTEQIFNPKQYGLEPIETFFYKKIPY
ncbi:chemotaxis protein methyltransferase [Pullulanibacillus camelliae]|uniref:protein-glutamate O-methyltransferase n=1 Tax=Pullulanibacillus camelliae TaxID=1707096 RepID=A0A8J2VMK3_9BACL|nr:protein-glutamate O-methyltransferase CheR [Pullulanibacillus camelliae]GGE38772.1 chemotaxis protein methyltransferase [Pullulanibacillus camelliae]